MTTRHTRKVPTERMTKALEGSSVTLEAVPLTETDAQGICRR